MSDWKVIGLDTFAAANEGEDALYTIAVCADEATAQLMAYTKLQALEESQPTETSGGQGVAGIQDRIFIERPDGTRYRVITRAQRKAALDELVALTEEVGGYSELHGTTTERDPAKQTLELLALIIFSAELAIGAEDDHPMFRETELIMLPWAYWHDVIHDWAERPAKASNAPA